MFGAGSISGPMQPAGAASMQPGHSLAFSPTTPPQAATAALLVRRQFSRERNEATGRVDAGAEPKLKLGAILGLISGLIADDEQRAAHLVLENLASSNLADSELSCTDSVFKDQLASLLSTHTADISHTALAAIQRRIQEDANDRHDPEIQSMPAGPLETTGTTAPGGRSNFRFCRPRRRLLLTASPAASSSSLHNGDALGESQSEEHARTSRAPNRASLRNENVRVREWVRASRRGSRGIHGRESVADTRAPTVVSSGLESDGGAYWEHGSFSGSNDEVGDEIDVDWYSLETVDDILAHTRAAFFQEDVEDPSVSMGMGYEGYARSSVAAGEDVWYSLENIDDILAPTRAAFLQEDL